MTFFHGKVIVFRMSQQVVIFSEENIQKYDMNWNFNEKAT